MSDPNNERDVHQFDRRQSDANLAALSVRTGAIEERVRTIELDLRANTLLTTQIATNTESLVAAMDSLKALWQFLSKWGRRSRSFAKHVTIYAVAITAAWAAVKTIFVVDIFEWLRAWWHK